MEEKTYNQELIYHQFTSYYASFLFFQFTGKNLGGSLKSINSTIAVSSGDCAYI